jgi:4a-hydroxytetrahydrobiopterin dehydratase
LQEISPEWQLSQDNKSIARTFKFNNYYDTMAFVNVVAMVAHRQDHHPDMTVTYNTCRVEFSTHSVGGLSLNDFICAAKVDGILRI